MPTAALARRSLGAFVTILLPAAFGVGLNTPIGTSVRQQAPKQISAYEAARQPFTVVIWGSDRGRFKEAPEVAYRKKRICVIGVISAYRGIPQIVVDSPEQIRIVSDAT